MLVKLLILSSVQCLKILLIWSGIGSLCSRVPPSGWSLQVYPRTLVFPSQSPSIPQRSFEAQGFGVFSGRREKGGSVGTSDTAPHHLISNYDAHRSFSGSVHRLRQGPQDAGGDLHGTLPGKDLGLQLWMPMPSSAGIPQRQTPSYSFPSL